MKKRVFDVAFKKMAMELSDAKGSVKEAAEELGIDSGRIIFCCNIYPTNVNSEKISSIVLIYY